MRLAELQAEFYRYNTVIEDYSVVDGDPATWEARGRPSKTITGPRHYLPRVPTLAEAQGVAFLCPKCFQENGGNVGTHSVHVDFEGRGVLPDQGIHGSDGKPVRWQVSGGGLEDLSTHPSIQIVGGCNWHGYITNGEVTVI